MKQKLVKVLCLVLALATIASCATLFIGCDLGTENNNSVDNSDADAAAEAERKKQEEEAARKKQEEEDLAQFLTITKESQELLDEIADEIYTNWCDAICIRSYYGSVNLAIAAAFSTKKEAVDKVKLNDPVIAEYFEKCKNLECGSLVKEVMTAYSDYYEFVTNGSGSFISYSAGKETKKNALATALRTLSYEL